MVTLGKTYLREGIHRLRDALGGWSELAEAVDVAVPTLYAWANLKQQKSPPFERALKLGIIDATHSGADRTARCVEWAHASGHDADTGDAFTAKVDEVAASLPAHHQALLSLLRHSKAVAALEGAALWGLSNRLSQDAFAHDVEAVLRQGVRLTLGCVWEWSDESRRRFSRTSISEFFQQIVRPPSEMRKNWRHPNADPTHLRVYVIPAYERAEDIRHEVGLAFGEVFNGFDQSEIERVSIHVAEKRPVSHHSADVWFMEFSNPIRTKKAYLVALEEDEFIETISQWRDVNFSGRPYQWGAGVMQVPFHRTTGLLAAYGLSPFESYWRPVVLKRESVGSEGDNHGSRS